MVAVLELLAVYGAIGIVIAAGFVARGLDEMMPQSSATLGARLVLLPGAAALWPLILRRWLAARRAR